MASLALTRPMYLQEGKIFPATDLYPASSLTNNLTALTLSFSRKNCYLTSDFHSWIRCGLFSTAWDTALHSKQELLLEHKKYCFNCWELQPVLVAGSFETALCIKEPYFPSQANPSPLPILLHSLTFNLNSGCPRWRQSLYVVSFAGENCALINTWRSAKKRKGNTNSYIIQLQPSAEFQLCVTSSSSCTDNWRAELGANQRHMNFNVINVLNTFLMERVWQWEELSQELQKALKKKDESGRTAAHSAQLVDVHFLLSGEHLWSKDQSCRSTQFNKTQCSGPQPATWATTIF